MSVIRGPRGLGVITLAVKPLLSVFVSGFMYRYDGPRPACVFLRPVHIRTGSASGKRRRIVEHILVFRVSDYNAIEGCKLDAKLV